MRDAVRRCVQNVRTVQIALGLLCLPKDVAEVTIGFELLAGKEVRGFLVLQGGEHLVEIHS